MEPLKRITPATVDVLRVLVESAGQVWGLLVVKETGRPAGSVYPILERLEGAGWVTSAWEDATERSGPRRRLYELSEAGAEAAREVIAQRRESRARATRPTIAGEALA